MQELKIDETYKNLLPQMSSDEYDALRESIKQNGQRDPIIVNESNTILDGHMRNSVCVDLCIEPKVRVEHFSSVQEEIAYIIDVNIHRRHLNLWQRALIAMRLLEGYRVLAHQRYEEHKPKKGQKGFTPVSDLIKSDTGAYSANAKKCSISADTLKKAYVIKQNASESMQQQLYDGTISIHDAYERVKTSGKIRVREQHATIKNDDVHADETVKLPVCVQSVLAPADDDAFAYIDIMHTSAECAENDAIAEAQCIKNEVVREHKREADTSVVRKQYECIIITGKVNVDKYVTSQIIEHIKRVEGFEDIEWRVSGSA